MVNFFSSPVPVLTYHRVLPYKTSLSVTVDEFEQQLLWLKEKGFHTLTSLEFQHALSGEHEVRHGLVITFDDGYRDSWHLAAPLLRKYGMNALLFAITGRIKEGEPKPITDGWLEEGDERYLSWQELREMVESGIFEIHSHTHTHDFSWIQAPLEEARRMVQRDIVTSVQTLRDRGYAHELHLAWPWGYFRKEWLDDLPSLGIRYSYTMRPGTNYPHCDTKTIMRLKGEMDVASLELLCSAGSSPVYGKMLNGVSKIWSTTRNKP